MSMMRYVMMMVVDRFAHRHTVSVVSDRFHDVRE